VFLLGHITSLLINCPNLLKNAIIIKGKVINAIGILTGGNEGIFRYYYDVQLVIGGQKLVDNIESGINAITGTH
jgi:hypothetical protein